MKKGIRGLGKYGDLTGQRFGRLLVIEQSFPSRWASGCAVWWKCKCDCGTEKDVVASWLVRGKVKSCGCWHMENKIKHGHTKSSGWRSPTYSTWRSIIYRCVNKTCAQYADYGGRGITVCDRWLGGDGFSHFLEDMGEKPDKKMSLDRVDNNSGYCKENCAWATQKQQARNRRDSHMLVFNGETKCISAWAESLGVKSQTIRNRLKKGWSVRRTLTVPVAPWSPKEPSVSQGLEGDWIL